MKHGFTTERRSEGQPCQWDYRRQISILDVVGVMGGDQWYA